MTQFYIPPDQIPSGIPQSEPTEITALKMQVQKMRKMLLLLEWSLYDGCPYCYEEKDAGHADHCLLAALLKETE